MEKHFSKERTLIIIKPDGIQRGLVGEIIGRYEKIGLKFFEKTMDEFIKAFAKSEGIKFTGTGLEHIHVTKDDRELNDLREKNSLIDDAMKVDENLKQKSE